MLDESACTPVAETRAFFNKFLKVVFMAQGKRDRLSAEQRTDMWCRWKTGESLHEIGRAFGAWPTGRQDFRIR